MAYRNVIAKNSIRKLSPSDMLRASSESYGTLFIDNKTVQTGYSPRSNSPCYLPYAYPSPLIAHGESVTMLYVAGQFECLSGEIICNDGLLEDSTGNLVNQYALNTRASGFNYGRVNPAMTALCPTDYSEIAASEIQRYPADFNAFVYGDLSFTPDSQGPIAAGGDITLTNANINHMDELPVSAVAGGDIGMISGTFHGNVYYAGETKFPYLLQVDRKGIVRHGDVIDFDSAFRELSWLSLRLAEQTYETEEYGDAVSCRERDSNGGDCQIRGQLICSE
jgi:hypothetical protein